MTDLLTEPCQTQRSALQARKVSSRELLAATFARIDAINPLLNAVIAEDRATAQIAADESDRRYADGTARALEGLPITIKDAFEAAGLLATCGSETLADHRPDEDAPAVARLRAAGAVIIGKTNVPPFSADWQTDNALHGRTNNPWDLARSPGGSSGGSATAVAAGMSAFELGSDIAGSIRWPCQATGIFGHKPTWGLISTRGHIPPAPWFASDPQMLAAGPLARDGGDLAMLMSVLASDPLAPARDTPRSWRIGLVTAIPGVATSLDVVSAVETAGRVLAESGAAVESVQPRLSLEGIWRAYLRQLCRMHHASRPSRARAGWAARAGSFDRDDLSPAAWLARTAQHTDAELLAELDERSNWWSAIDAVFARYDVLLMPPAPTAALPHDDRAFEERTMPVDGQARSVFEMAAWVAPATLLHLPATTAPVAATSAGLPLGVQVVGPLGADLTTIRIATTIAERARGYRPPPIALAHSR